MPIFNHCLIFDRHPADRLALHRLIAGQPDWVVVGEAATAARARRLLDGCFYSLVFVDEDLIGGDGFELLPYVKSGARVVFTARNPRHALRAFEVQALDYLVKPVRAERLANTLHRLETPVDFGIQVSAFKRELRCPRQPRYRQRFPRDERG